MVLLATQQRDSRQPWISSSISNLLKRLKTVASKNPRTLALVIKREKLEGQVQEALQGDLENFEKTVFEVKVFSRIQKYLKAIRKTPEIPPVVKYDDKESFCGDEQCNMFNDYLLSVFNALLLQSNEITFPRQILNQLKLTLKIVFNYLKSLGENKAMGPDKIGNLIMKNCSRTLCQ